MSKAVAPLHRAAGCLRNLTWGCSVLVAAALPVPALAAAAPVVTVGAPAGFDALTARQTLLVDVYFGGVRRGEAKIVATPDTIAIVEPAVVLAMLPPLADSSAVKAILAAPGLSANAGLACSPAANRATCGRLSPAVAGVILDRDTLRLDVFLNPRFLAVHSAVEERYLPPPAGGLSMINAVGAVLSGSSGSDQDYYNLQDQVVLADGERRLRADLSYANGYGLAAERVALELDRPELRYSAGALWTPGDELTGQRKLLGVGVESQVDTRLDKDEILGSPVVVYLDQRARVDVVREGRVLGSAIYEAGNQEIDTSNLPEGSYDIVLRIQEPGRPPREERRFFTKSRRIPSRGRTDFSAYGGVLVADDDPGSLRPSRRPYFAAGAARRLTGSWALEGEFQATDRGASGELAATLLTRFANVRAAAVADLDGRYGGILQVSSSGASRFNVDFDLRHIESHDATVIMGAPLSAAAPLPAVNPLDPFAMSDIAHADKSYSQADAVVSFSLGAVRFLGVLSYRDEEAQKASYSIGPSLQWDLLRKGPFTFTLRADMAATESGASEFAGISLRLLGPRTSLTALGGARTSTIADDNLGNGAVGSIAGTWGAGTAGGQLALGAGYEHQPRQDSLVLSTQFDHPLGSFSGDFTRSGGDGSSTSQYSLGLQTTIAAGSGGLRIAGKTTTDSMVVAHVDGAGPGDSFEVLVNEQLAGTIVGNQALTLALPSYRAYDVRIRSTGKDLLAYDSSPRRIGLFPGAMTRLDWKVAPVILKFGRLVAPDGTPLAHASISGQGVWSETDGAGNFQIEVADDARLTVTLANGNSFVATLPSATPKDGVARLGVVACAGATVLAMAGPRPPKTPEGRLIR